MILINNLVTGNLYEENKLRRGSIFIKNDFIVYE